MSREQLERFVEAIENLITEEKRHSDPPSAHYIPHDLARWFLEAAKGLLKGDEKSLDRALGLLRSPGRPVDPHKSKNFDLAERALIRMMQGTFLKIENSRPTSGISERLSPGTNRSSCESGGRTFVGGGLPVLKRERKVAFRKTREKVKVGPIIPSN
jgi:hypothetical protein